MKKELEKLLRKFESEKTKAVKNSTTCANRGHDLNAQYFDGKADAFGFSIALLEQILNVNEV